MPSISVLTSHHQIQNMIYNLFGMRLIFGSFLSIPDTQRVADAPRDTAVGAAVRSLRLLPTYLCKSNAIGAMLQREPLKTTGKRAESDLICFLIVLVRS